MGTTYVPGVGYVADEVVVKGTIPTITPSATGHKFNVDKFKNTFVTDPPSPAYFRFELLKMPPFIKNYPDLQRALSAESATDRLSVRVKKAMLPDQSLQTMQHSYYGPLVKYPHENLTTDLNVEVICSHDMWERQFFTAWQNYILDYGISARGASYNIAYFEDYVSDIDIVLFDAEAKEIYRATFENAYPMQMGSVDVDWTAKDSIMSFYVTFSYSYWSPSTKK